MKTHVTKQDISSSRAWLIWIIAAIFFFLEYVVRVSPGAMSAEIMRDFHITALDFGMLSLFFYVSYIAMQMPVGAVLDRFNIRWLLATMALLCALGCFIFSFSHHFDLLLLSRLIIGLTGAFAFVGALKLATIWLPLSRLGLLAGATQAIGMLGASTGDGPLSALVTQTSWRFSYMLLGIALMILMCLMIFIVRDRPANSEKSAYGRMVVYQDLLCVLRNPLTWVNGLFIGLLYAPTAAFGELWGPLYLHQVDTFSHQQAASVVSMIFIGWAIGSPVIGWLSDYLKRRKAVMVLSALCSLLFLMILLYMPGLAFYDAMGIAFLYGVSNVGVSIGYAVACDINSKRLAGISLGFTNMASIGIGAALQPVIGYILDKEWHGTYQAGTRLYTSHDLHMAMLVLPAILIICLICGFFLKETLHRKKTT